MHVINELLFLEWSVYTMRTAKDFVSNPDFYILPQFIGTDPGRLRHEFLAIAADLNEPILYRLRALGILHYHANELGVYSVLEANGLIAAFEREFAPELLNEIADSERVGRRHYYSLVLVRFCLTLARVAGDSAQAQIDSVRQVFKGTWRDSSLNSQLETIKQRRDRADL
jgi:hypothetical protein